MTHKAGFVNIVGLPNVGKSSLINMLIDEKLSIVNSKSQTTRQNINGFIHGEDFQIILVDTPGFIDTPSYQLQLHMNSYVELALEESDVLLWVVDKYTLLDASHPMVQQIIKANKPTFLIVNKIDQCTPEEVESVITHYTKIMNFSEIYPLSAQMKLGRTPILESILKYIPDHPAYYDKEDWTDRNLRFFCSEIIREKVFTNYQKEIPYSTEVVITEYTERSDSVKIEAVIYVERESQKKIIIGHQAEKLKRNIHRFSQRK